MKYLILASVLALSGCASSGPIPIGKDTYMISKQSAGGIYVAAGSIKAGIFREANTFCESQNKSMQVVNTYQQSAVPGRSMPEAEIQFMCLSDGDRDLARPKLRKEADTVIRVD